MAGEFTIDYVVLPNGRAPAREFIESLDEEAVAKVDAFIDRLRVYGTRMHGKFVRKLSENLMELRVKHFDRIFRILYFYQPGRSIVITSGFQKKTEQTPAGEVARAERLKALWLRYRNNYPGSREERERIARHAGL